MSDIIFPNLPGMTFPVIKQPTFSTIQQESVSGLKKNIANWLYPRWEITIPYSCLRDNMNFAGVYYNELQTLIGLFMACRGRFDTFLFDDPDDNFISGQELGVGDGNTTAFQMIRSWGGFVEPVFNIKSLPAPIIYLNGVAQDPSTYSIAMTASGLLTFGAPPARGFVITADFGYYWRCLFQEDLSEIQKFMKNIWEHKGIKIETVKGS